MSQKLLVGLTVVSLLVAMFITGCGPEEKIGLKFNSGDVSTYQAGYETKQSVELDMAQETPTKDKHNTKKVEVTFTQEIQSVNDDSSAVAKITIMDISILTKDSDVVSFSFDSSKPEDSKRPLNALIGKSYTINISSDGTVTPADGTAIRSVKITGSERNVAKNLLSDEEIISRHEIDLPKKGASSLKKGQGWAKVVWSHPKIMAKKSFEKSYMIDSIDGDVANVTMTAYETAKTAEGPAPKGSGFGFMAGMFDSQEKYTGEMKIDLASGKVVKWDETCIADYIVTDKTSKNDKGEPASLKMGLTHSISLEKID
ncbi:MAG: hypothetical protein K9M75_07930 [Phycisphaerae bacterium]|nr:hypothetical protein [Phycisphaerae bacterium]